MSEDTPALNRAQTDTDAPETIEPIRDDEVATPEETPPVADEPAKRRGIVVPVLLVICLLAIAGLGWQWWAMRGELAKTQEELTRRLSESDNMAREARASARQSIDTLTSVQGKVGLLEAKAEEAGGQAAALDALYQEFSRTRDERTMAEIEQAVTIAGQQLQLAGNVEAALIALQAADARLSGFDEARLGPLRRSLKRDIERLRAAPRVDIAGITLRLEGLLESVDRLPLAFTGEAVGSEAPEKTATGSPMDDPLGFAQAVLHDWWAEIRSLVRVERLDRSAEPVLLSPSQSTYLRENLKIRLLTARLALLGRDHRTFEADMRQAAEWLGKYFDQRDEGVTETLTSLKTLAETQIAPTQPALTETLAVLKTLQGKPSVSGAGPAPQATKAAAVPKAVKPAADAPEGKPDDDVPAVAPAKAAE
ncbi:MAG TPA: uroporphyrinogen-III C-methyltransferase [Denitromonas sp.]|uniref:uroporphyrinogen-III C-methyltransferase n=1 Tax=Denitromonas sp. TaxID=2734609 RepID=UPI001DC037AE|nr:uroporphyrinogen-III C-methyltransferase [Rhodocyclaceae bacterium]MCP5221547.1 uroporphyrinogen-III C-methyltransferase [Zoogloeaceae bacterium]HPR05390.1 uroporphyrinogen-III C-methyltransferase [Denitromonas sp.]HQU89814.1 uroporphyrinogen-III C-methyltransferase [Denitromonas sp.]HQV15833.1 uroporphyrinogen-III C-methyltransferase [Denitromonas sp.]